MNSFVLKLIAICSMFIDHLRYIIPTQPMFMAYIGRFAFPIFSFQIVQGYLHTKNFKKYLLRLLIIALISQLPYQLYFNTTGLNVLFTLILGLICIYIYEHFFKINKFLSIISILSILCISEVFECDYSYYGVCIILSFYIFRNKTVPMSLSFIILTLIYYILTYKNLLFIEAVWLFSFCISSLIPCLLYNGKQGPKIKYLFYLFYPVHIVVLLLLTHLQYFYNIT